jgi:cysteinyl-tRNA synthetase
VKKTYVVNVLDVDLIERYAREEGQELKDVVNLAFHEFFARRRYLPVEE